MPIPNGQGNSEAYISIGIGQEKLRAKLVIEAENCQLNRSVFEDVLGQSPDFPDVYLDVNYQNKTRPILFRVDWDIGEDAILNREFLSRFGLIDNGCLARA